MTIIRKHIVDDMTTHISGELVRHFKRQVDQLEAAGVTSEEGALISAKVGKQLLVATVGGATLLTGTKDLDKTFTGLLTGIVIEILACRASIMANLADCAEVSSHA